jgi:hypothetical protein
VGAGLNLQTHVYVATNATYYKYFENWALGKGLPLSHVVNSGRSLADNRVGLDTLTQVIAAARRHIAGAHGSVPAAALHDVLVVAADSVPPHAGFPFHGVVDGVLRAGTSAVLLQPSAAQVQQRAAADRG